MTHGCSSVHQSEKGRQKVLSWKINCFFYSAFSQQHRTCLSYPFIYALFSTLKSFLPNIHTLMDASRGNSGLVSCPRIFADWNSQVSICKAGPHHTTDLNKTLALMFVRRRNSLNDKWTGSYIALFYSI